jgi:hypothetical protein
MDPEHLDKVELGIPQLLTRQLDPMITTITLTKHLHRRLIILQRLVQLTMPRHLKDPIHHTHPARRTVPTTRIHRTNQVQAQLDIKLLLVPLDMLQLPVQIREFLSILLPVLHPATHHRHL